MAGHFTCSCPAAKWVRLHTNSQNLKLVTGWENLGTTIYKQVLISELKVKGHPETCYKLLKFLINLACTCACLSWWYNSSATSHLGRVPFLYSRDDEDHLTPSLDLWYNVQNKIQNSNALLLLFFFKVVYINHSYNTVYQSKTGRHLLDLWLAKYGMTPFRNSIRDHLRMGILPNVIIKLAVIPRRDMNVFEQADEAVHQWNAQRS